MNSNRFNKIFESKSSLGRKDITAYGKTNDEKIKHSIEANASDPFESDALEGWEELSYDISNMRSLDKTFAPNNILKYYIVSSVIVGLSIVGIALFIQATQETKDNKDVLENTKILTSEKAEKQEFSETTSDVNIPERIEQMNLAPKEKQIEVLTIQNNFQAQKTIKVPQKLELLPFKKLETQSKTTISRSHRNVEEIYLYNLKLVDYKKYRSRTKLKSEEVALSGTPASIELNDKGNTVQIENSLEIPYHNYIIAAIEALSQEEYKLALTKLETILNTYPDDVNGNFYAGLCFFNLGEYDKAIGTFENCIHGPFSNFDEESHWMIALSLKELGQKQQAHLKFKAIINQGGFYKEQAVAQIKQLIGTAQ